MILMRLQCNHNGFLRYRGRASALDLIGNAPQDIRQELGYEIGSEPLEDIFKQHYLQPPLHVPLDSTAWVAAMLVVTVE